MPTPSRWRLGPESEGRRLDVLLTILLDDLSRARAQNWIEQGHVELNGRSVRASHRCHEGDRVSVRIPEPAPAEPAPEDIPLDVVFEDAALIVVNKPPGIVVHPAPGHVSGTLVNALLHHCQDLRGVSDVLRPGIVHRLDRGTSGLMVVAKDDAAHRSLSKQFQDRTVKKTYLALVYGSFPNKITLSNPIGRDRHVRTKISSRSDRARAATSVARRERQLCACSLVSVQILTGRTHQIRVHLSEAGYPLVGDQDYPGSRPQAASSEETKALAVLSRFERVALHAAELSFQHPGTDEPMEFTLPLPDDMAELINEVNTD